MALKAQDRVVLFIYSVLAVLAIILGAVSVNRTITFQSGASCASGSFLVKFPFLRSDFQNVCSSVETAASSLQLAVILFTVSGILWPIYFTYFSNGRLDANQWVKSISFVGSIAFIATFYALRLGHTTSQIYSGEDSAASAASIKGVVDAFSVVAIIGGGFQIALFNFREGQSMLRGGGNMDGGFDYVQM
jgi:hypothetical protein